MLLRIALRNIWLHRLRTLIVGSIITFGTILVIVGNAVLDAVESGMEKSVVHSVTGHLQLYSGSASDQLSVFGQPGGREIDIGQLDNYEKIKEALGEIDNISAAVPMGIDYSLVLAGNLLDVKITELRKAIEAEDEAAQQRLIRHLRRIIDVLAENVGKYSDIIEATDEDREGLAALQRAKTDAFWARFETEPVKVCDILDDEIAPLGVRADMIFLRYIATDPTLFQDTFELFKIVDGEMIPPGKRGFLFNKRIYERFVKNRVAYQLDRIKEAKEEGERNLTEDEEMQEWVRRNVRQRAQILQEIEPDAVADVVAGLQQVLGAETDDLDTLLEQLLQTTDANFEAHYAAFYEHVAPRIVLYRYPIGSTLLLSSFKRSSAKRVPVKIYGTFEFESLERSTLAGSSNLMDLMTFRELYGFMTPEKEAENARIKAANKVKAIERDNVEDALFGGGDEAPSPDLEPEVDPKALREAAAQGFEIDEDALKQAVDEARERLKATFTQEELDTGTVLNVAVMLEDATKLEETQAKIDALGKERGLNYQSMKWREASGLVGQLATAMRWVLNLAILIIFTVALVIINNSMMMATMERVREIGTMRAIGAQRGFILKMFLVETVALSVIFMIVGAILGSLWVMGIQSEGIPATQDVLYFLFGGPVLRPPLELGHVISAVTLVMVVTVVSTLYTARIAVRISPIEAMQAKE